MLLQRNYHEEFRFGIRMGDSIDFSYLFLPSPLSQKVDNSIEQPRIKWSLEGLSGHDSEVAN